jgi:hypothetical protein
MDKLPGRVAATLTLIGFACVLILVIVSPTVAGGTPVTYPPISGIVISHPVPSTGGSGSSSGSSGISGISSSIGTLVGSPDAFTHAQKPMTIDLPTLAGVNTGTTGTAGTTGGTTVGTVLTGTIAGTQQITSKGSGSTLIGKAGTNSGSNLQKSCTGVNCSSGSTTGIQVASGGLVIGGKANSNPTGTALTCPVDKPVKTCSKDTATGKTVCSCSDLVSKNGTATGSVDIHAGQKWCELQMCSKKAGTKLVPNGFVGGVWVNMDAECPTCSDKLPAADAQVDCTKTYAPFSSNWFTCHQSSYGSGLQR